MAEPRLIKFVYLVLQRLQTLPYACFAKRNLGVRTDHYLRDRLLLERHREERREPESSYTKRGDSLPNLTGRDKTPLVLFFEGGMLHYREVRKRTGMELRYPLKTGT
jgi:hypothetical protein